MYFMHFHGTVITLHSLSPSYAHSRSVRPDGTVYVCVPFVAVRFQLLGLRPG